MEEFLMSVNPKIMYSLLPIMSLQVKAETSRHASEQMIPHGAMVEMCPFSDRYGNLRKIRVSSRCILESVKIYFKFRLQVQDIIDQNKLLVG